MSVKTAADVNNIEKFGDIYTGIYVCFLNTLFYVFINFSNNL